jgi:hypothetical protein
MIGDTLVFRVVEKDDSPQKEDTDMYIIYDSYHSVFLLRGKRSDTSKFACRPYSFEAYGADNVALFLSMLIPREHHCLFELYAYPNLPKNKDEITFDLLRNDMDPANEIVGYNAPVMSKKFSKILKILEGVGNDYTPPVVETEWPVDENEWGSDN